MIAEGHMVQSSLTKLTIAMTDSDQTTKPEDRSDLLAKARSFLASPQVRTQDVNAKRAFLVEKGLNDTEIAELLRTIVCVYMHMHYCT
jgi:hypothetical protein